jgi:hypothetical protein
VFKVGVFGGEGERSLSVATSCAAAEIGKVDHYLEQKTFKTRIKLFQYIIIAFLEGSKIDDYQDSVLY